MLEADPEVFACYIKNYGPELKPARRLQPDRAARMPAIRSLGTSRFREHGQVS
jgi:hypothetical protein